MFGPGGDVGSWVIAAAVAIASAGVSVAVTIAVLVRLRADHFACEHQASKSLATRVGRNVGGVVLVALGVFLSLPGVPGQGLLTILLGIMCLDIPGKRRVELWILRRPSVLGGIDKLRARYGKPPLELPEEPPRELAGASPDASSEVGALSEAAATSEVTSAGDATTGDAAATRGAAAASRRDTTR